MRGKMTSSISDIFNTTTTLNVSDGMINVTKSVTAAVLTETTDRKIDTPSSSTSFQRPTETPQDDFNPGFAYNPILSVLILVVVGIISIETVISNTMVLLAIYIERPLRHAPNYLITSLAFCDMQIGILSFVFCTDTIFHYWFYGWLACQIALVTHWALYVMSKLLACLIAVDGYLNVTSYKYRQWRTDTKVLVFLSISFSVNYVSWIVVYSLARSGKEDTRPTCDLRIMPRITYTTQSAIFWGSLLVLVYLYWRFYRLRKDHNNTAMSKDLRRSEIMVINMTYNCSEQEDGEGSAMKTSNECEGSGDNQIVIAKEASMYNEIGGYQRVYRSETQEDNYCSVRVQRSLSRSSISSAVICHVSRFRNQVREHACQNSDANSNSTDGWIDNLAPSSEVDPPSSLSPPTTTTPFEKAYFSNRSKTSSRQIVNAPRRLSHTRMRKAKWTVSFILCTYIICYGPFAIFMLIELISRETFRNVPFDLVVISFQLTYFNSALNPFLYAYRSKMYRNTYKRILKFDWKKNNLTVLHI